MRRTRRLRRANFYVNLSRQDVRLMTLTIFVAACAAVCAACAAGAAVWAVITR